MDGTGSDGRKQRCQGPRWPARRTHGLPRGGTETHVPEEAHASAVCTRAEVESGAVAACAGSMLPRVHPLLISRGSTAAGGPEGGAERIRQVGSGPRGRESDKNEPACGQKVPLGCRDDQPDAHAQCRREIPGRAGRMVHLRGQHRDGGHQMRDARHTSRLDERLRSICERETEGTRRTETNIDTRREQRINIRPPFSFLRSCGFTRRRAAIRSWLRSGLHRRRARDADALALYNRVTRLTAVAAVAVAAGAAPAMARTAAAAALMTTRSRRL